SFVVCGLLFCFSSSCAVSYNSFALSPQPTSSGSRQTRRNLRMNILQTWRCQAITGYVRFSSSASHPERPLRALREQGFERHRLSDHSLLVHVAHERLERAPIALNSVWPEVLAHQVHGLVSV